MVGKMLVGSTETILVAPAARATTVLSGSVTVVPTGPATMVTTFAWGALAGTVTMLVELGETVMVLIDGSPEELGGRV